jgi:hypothetical protein
MKTKKNYSTCEQICTPFSEKIMDYNYFTSKKIFLNIMKSKCRETTKIIEKKIWKNLNVFIKHGLPAKVKRGITPG